MKKLDLINKIKNQLSAIVKGEYAMIKAGEMMLYTPDEELMMGSEIFLMDESNNAVDLTDGEYALDNGVVIKVEAGKVVSMSSEKEEVEMEEVVEEVIEEVIEEKETELVVKMAEIINEKTGEGVTETDSMDIAEELIAKVLEIVEESDDMDDFKEKAFGIKKEMEEVIEEEVEVMVDEEEKIKEMEAKFNAQIATLEAKIAELSAEPAEDSIDKKKVEFRDVNDKTNVTLDVQSFRERIRKNR